jgi:hypothetical protein
VMAFRLIRRSGGVTLIARRLAGHRAHRSTARRWASRHPPVHPGERVTYVRWWLEAETYQKPSPAQSLLAVQLTRHYLTTPGLAVSLVPTADPDTWLGPMIYTDQHPMPEAGFALGGHRYSVFGHDW